ncbi:spike base protein, RCAP_Rcc01079 family [Pseudooceanicola sp. C21-150M6]|uniref:spike base protein, RCAP_Rcc01079 family n=1 Tax=Pseudooceanicola sp. C21-150M6 TaxID=3434355 RepID=UPI003D7F6ADD
MGRIPNMGRSFAAVTPHDTNRLAGGSADAFWIGSPGDVALKGENGETVTFIDVAGLLPVGGSFVLSTGTTATDIVAIYG